MTPVIPPVSVRPATADDRAFIDSLSPRLARVPGPPWHDTAAMDGFQDRHMAAPGASKVCNLRFHMLHIG